MTYIMQLDPSPMAAAREGRKTVELRLYDEKRRRIHVGDCITFLNRADAADSLTVRVTALHPYATFDELYAALPATALGYGEGEDASPRDMDAYYTPEDQVHYGVLGIAFELL